MILSKKLVSKNRKDIQVMRDLGKTYEECQKQLWTNEAENIAQGTDTDWTASGS